MDSDSHNISLSTSESAHLAMGLGMLLEYVTGHMKVKVSCSTGHRLMQNIEVIMETYKLTEPELIALMDKFPTPIPKQSLGVSTNVSVLPS